MPSHAIATGRRNTVGDDRFLHPFLVLAILSLIACPIDGFHAHPASSLVISARESRNRIVGVPPNGIRNAVSRHEMVPREEEGEEEADSTGRRGALTGLASFGLTAVASLAIFWSVPFAPSPADARSSEAPPGGYVAPGITTTSTPRTIALGLGLKSLDSTMYGAFWCSHCYDQKQTLGMEVMQNFVPYVECDKEGKNTQRPLCQKKDVPGYPTWEIGGKLFPGEMSLEELEEIVVKQKGAAKI